MPVSVATIKSELEATDLWDDPALSDEDRVALAKRRVPAIRQWVRTVPESAAMSSRNWRLNVKILTDELQGLIRYIQTHEPSKVRSRVSRVHLFGGGGFE